MLQIAVINESTAISDADVQNRSIKEHHEKLARLHGQLAESYLALHENDLDKFWNNRAAHHQKMQELHLQEAEY